MKKTGAMIYVARLGIGGSGACAPTNKIIKIAAPSESLLKRAKAQLTRDDAVIIAEATSTRHNKLIGWRRRDVSLGRRHEVIYRQLLLARRAAAVRPELNALRQGYGEVNLRALNRRRYRAARMRAPLAY